MDTFLYGAALYEEYVPEDRLGKDVQLMERTGIGVVRVGESTWSPWEPEDGRVEFGAHSPWPPSQMQSVRPGHCNVTRPRTCTRCGKEISGEYCNIDTTVSDIPFMFNYQVLGYL